MSRLLGALVVLLLLVVSPPAWSDTGPGTGASTGTGTGPTLSLDGPTTAAYGSVVTLTARLSGADGTGVGDRTVTLSRQDGTAWTDVATATTDATGAAAFTRPVPRASAPLTYRATAQDPGGAVVSAPRTVTGVRAPTVLTLTMPHSVVDGHRVPLTLIWRSSAGDAVPGVVEVFRRVPHGPWQRFDVRRLGPDGRARLVARPRRDTRWRAVGASGTWWAGATSSAHALDNRPPGLPVTYPDAAPRPLPLPAQRHAVGSGPHPRVQRLPDAVWASMVGRTWHRGCPVGRAELRLVRVNYWDFDGYRRRGEMVVRARVAGRVAGALADMYRGGFPIRAMYRVDRFGWSDRSHGGDDFAAMRHDDSSAFNCRWVTGSPGRTSPHSYGTAVDINTFENPFWSAVGPLPDRWWAGHSDPRIAWRSASHPVVRIWRRHGFAWTYGTGDSQHLDGRRTTDRSVGAFVAVVP
ncbi:MAG: M15 family metallopeptidase [Marmoricola sp.]